MRVVLKALNGVLQSKAITVPDNCRAALYYAFLPQFCFGSFMSEDTLPNFADIEVLKFEPTGRIFRDKKKELIFEFALTKV